MAKRPPSPSPACEQCGEPNPLAVPLGAEHDLHIYCLDCIGDRIEYALGFRTRKLFKSWALAREHGLAMQAQLDGV